MLFNAGLSYSAICVAGSALSSYLDCKDSAQFGEHKRVRQFIKGVFEKRPAPHKPVSKNALARQVLNGADVDTAQFSAHSTRAASTSAALSSGVPVDVVLRAARWSSESTFTRFYRKEPAVNMGQACWILISAKTRVSAVKL